MSSPTANTPAKSLRRAPAAKSIANKTGKKTIAMPRSGSLRIKSTGIIVISSGATSPRSRR